MKQLLILSGKGGTGKTTVASAFIKLSGAKAFADCDVDAPNLHLLMGQKSEPQRTDFCGMPKAKIDTDMCIQCDQCAEHCRFDAISVDSNGVYSVDKIDCEGCGVCEFICPVGAITLEPEVSGELMLYNEDDKVFSTAQLRMGSGHSGLLVTEVKNQMKETAENVDFAIIDGSPGIGCPVIASLSGVDMVLIVTEPSISGFSDMERIIETAEVFGTKTAVCVNKYDTNTDNTKKIEEFCKSRGLPYVGKIPFDPEAVKAINNGMTTVDVDCSSGRAAKGIYKNTMQVMHE